MYQTGCGIPEMAPVTLEQLSVGFADLLGQKLVTPLLGTPAGDDKGIVDVGLLQAKRDPSAFGDVAKGGSRTGLVDQFPPNRRHVGFRPEAVVLFDLQGKLAMVVLLVAGFAEADQVVKPVTTGFVAFDVVDIQDFVLPTTLRGLTLMAIPVEDVLTDVPEACLVSVLVVCAFDIRFFDLLDVEGRHLDGCLRDSQDCLDLFDHLDVAVQFVPNRETR